MNPGNTVTPTGLAGLSLLLVEDDLLLRKQIAAHLERLGADVTGVATLQEARRLIGELDFDLVFLDVNLPDGSGLEVLDKLLATLPGTPVIMISAHGDTRVAVKAVKAGAFDYLTKPFELDEMLLTIRSALERERMSQEIARFREATLAGGELVGESPVVRTLAEATRQVGASHAGRVLLLGESGSGKALVARAIHSHSSRAKGPFVEVNCAALPEQLIEAELFGAEKGSYTGAMQRRVGLVAQEVARLAGAEGHAARSPETAGGGAAVVRPRSCGPTTPDYVPEPGSRCLATNAAAWARR